MGTKTILGTDTKGVYRRYIGWKLSDGKIIQHLFRLGRDEAKAKLANMRLESLWNAVAERWNRLKAEDRATAPRPLWDETTLAIAQAVAKGEATCAVSPPPEVAALLFEMQVAWLGRLQADLPIIPLRLSDPDTYLEGVEGIRAVIECKKELLTTLNEPVSNKTLHQALDAYSVYIGEKYKEKPSNRSQQTAIGLLKKHTEAVTLDRLDADRIEIWLAYWCRRPTGQAGTPLAFTTCRNVLIVFRQFLHWLNRSPQFDWHLPIGFTFRRCKIDLTEADRLKKRKHFKVAELKIIWQYAKPWDRALILLSLNCGFCKAEIATLTLDEIVESSKGTYIKRHRRKTDVYGEWRLWPETIEALEHLDQYRPQGSRHVVVNQAGNPLTRKTKKDNENQVIKNHWDHIFERIRADYPDFYKLPFKHLRKTGATLLRHMKIENAAELASMYLAHGESSDNEDQLLPVYAARPWKKLHRALRRLRKKLLPVTSSVERPWEGTLTRASPLLVSKIRALRGEGKTLEEVAKEVGLHWTTVGKICRRERDTARSSSDPVSQPS